MSPRLAYREHAPCPGLAGNIACYWTLDAEHTPGHRVLPDGCMDLLFDLGDRGGAEIIGTMTRAIVTPSASHVHFLGVRFLPGEAFAFVGVPACEGTDRTIALGDVWGRFGASLHDELLSAEDTAARLRILDTRLLARRAVAADPRLRTAIDRIRAARGAVRVAVVAKTSGVGERHLERLFDERVGVGPKTLAKVLRMQSMLAAVAARDRPWSAIAQDFGWSDQSHLARDLKALAGITPAELARSMKMSDSSNPPHGPLATDPSP